MGLLRQSLLILGLSALIAAVLGFIHPKAPTPPWLEVANEFALTAEDLSGLTQPIWIDARSQEAYSKEHAPGAIHLNEDNWDTGFINVIEAWIPGTPLIVYCDANDCHASEAVAQRLRRELGIEEAYYLQGGWASLVDHLK